MNAQEIAALIRSGVPGATVEVRDTVGDGNHFEAVVIASEFAGKALVQRHQLVYGSLKGAMADRIHALSITAVTPEEWQRRQA